VQKVFYRGGIRTSGLQGCFHRLLQLAATILLAELQQADHLPSAVLLPLPRHQLWLPKTLSALNRLMLARFRW
jgi:hypothetical protein